MNHYALHVPLGEADLVKQIDRWLAAYDLRVQVCSDAYELCGIMARQYENAPDLVLIGTDWLLADEFQVFQFVYSTWPEALIIAYGCASDQVPLEVGARFFPCPSPRALIRLLAESPTTLLDRHRLAVRSPQAGDSRLALLATSGPGEVAADRSAQSSPSDCRFSSESSAQLTAAAGVVSEPPAARPRSPLTPAERRTLLGESEG